VALSFACALGHAPGITAWRDKAPAAQAERLYAAFGELSRRLETAALDALVLFTAEHWANFFLDHISPFCIGRAASFPGPIEPWLKIERAAVPGEPELAAALLEACQSHDIEPGFAHELHLDHGTMVPLHFLTPRMTLPIVPIVINTLAAPTPAPRRCCALGKVVGEVLRRHPKRIGLVATGGMSHDPGERRHGFIDEAFDHRFLEQMRAGDLTRLESYTTAELAAAGAGALELLNWIALAGATQGACGEVLAYEPVVPWATGIGAMSFDMTQQSKHG
jgi:aromatic ring-opening dioxygenase catalytic subunit (LigB family)